MQLMNDYFYIKKLFLRVVWQNGVKVLQSVVMGSVKEQELVFHCAENQSSFWLQKWTSSYLPACTCWYVFRWRAHSWRHYFIYFSWPHSAGCWWRDCCSGAKWLQSTWMKIGTWSTTISSAGVQKSARQMRYVKTFLILGFDFLSSFFIFCLTLQVYRCW